MAMDSLCAGVEALAHSAPTVRWWLGLNAVEQGTWFAGIGAFAAAVVALGIALSDAVRRRSASRGRGDVVLAMALPELSRLKALFVEADLRLGCMKGEFLRDGGHAVWFRRNGPKFRSPLESLPADAFVDLPRHLTINLPTCIHALPAVEAQTGALATLVNDPRDEFVAEKIAEVKDFLAACAIEFNAATQYFDKKINPRQMKNMKPFLPVARPPNKPQ
ncbi:hypothetical protein DyAD56_16115 [Dyella sp. AD56]|uniref:hypothetical protein n=1 Tax=Dyella sp. AD56 TaxID=1528744 RepID=UPI000C85E7F5|nr:hypothetical protein [Dyella sp. AD56]PMQ04214.1 hypothetical protein DyAD56_16115 [Dyella sp. AD56]